MGLGSVSTGYSDKPVAMAIKIKHAGFNLTGRDQLLCRMALAEPAIVLPVKGDACHETAGRNDSNLQCNLWLCG